MLSSKNLKTKILTLHLKWIRAGAISVCRRPVSLRPMTNSLVVRVTQPGLPSWWRLAAPHLNWISAFVKHLSWALLVLGPKPLLISGGGKLKVDRLVTRHRLITLTRGPMARKKRSRVQFMLPKRPLQLRLASDVTEPLRMSPSTTGAGLKQVAAEEDLWLDAIPTPATVTKTTLTINIGGVDFLV